MFLKTHRVRKDGKEHVYFSLCESLRVIRKRVLQRQVLHLGELNSHQLDRWQRTIEVVQENGSRHQMRLFAWKEAEQKVAAAPEDVAEVVLSSLLVRRPRTFGACWVGCKLFEELGLREFWQEALGEQAGAVLWAKVVELLADNLETLRRRGGSYLVGTPRSALKTYKGRLLEGEWQSVSGEVEVQLIAEEKETYVLARSHARAQKEKAMRLRVVRGLMRDLIRLRRLIRNGRLKDPDKVLLRLGGLAERYPQAWRYAEIKVEGLGLRWNWDRQSLRLAQSRDGAYLLRTNLAGSDPAALWRQYVQLTEVEAVFRALKSDLAIRPIWHFTPKRVEAHILVAFLGYCLWVCLKAKLRASAPSLSPWQLLDQFARIQLVEV